MKIEFQVTSLDLSEVRSYIEAAKGALRGLLHLPGRHMESVPNVLQVLREEGYTGMAPTDNDLEVFRRRVSTLSLSLINSINQSIINSHNQSIN